MKRFAAKIFLFLVPLLALHACIIFFVPPDSYTFSPRTSTQARYVRLLTGPFYPERNVTTMEQGDLGHYTPFAVDKKITWITDEFGYRNTPPATGKYDIVVAGDSLALGCGVSQENTLARLIARDTGKRVYNYSAQGSGAAASMEFLDLERFKENPPDVVILQQVDRHLLPAYMRPSGSGIKSKVKSVSSAINERIAGKTPIMRVLEYTDRLLRASYINHLKFTMKGAAYEKIFRKPEAMFPELVRSVDGSMLFFDYTVNFNPPERTVSEVADLVEMHRNRAESKGIRFIFMPVPHKVDVYFDLLPEHHSSGFIPALVAELKSRGVEVIDLSAAYREARKTGGSPLYFPDDTHWTERGIGIAAKLIEKRITVAD